MISYFKFKFKLAYINDLEELVHFEEWTDFVLPDLEEKAKTLSQKYYLLKRLMHGEFDYILQEEGFRSRDF